MSAKIKTAATWFATKRRIVLLAALGVAAVGVAVPVAITYAAAGEVIVPTDTYAPCWATTRIGPNNRRELIIGSMWGLLENTAPKALADAWYDNGGGDCGYGDTALADVPANTEYWVRLDTAYAVDANSSRWGTVGFEIDYRKLDSPDCGGPFGGISTVSKTVSFSSTPKYDWKEEDVWDMTNCGTGSCIGFIITTPGPSQSESYQYRLTTTVTPNVGSAAIDVEFGCFDVGTAGP